MFKSFLWFIIASLGCIGIVAMVWSYSLRQPSNNVTSFSLTPTATVVLDSALLVPTFTPTPTLSATDTPEPINISINTTTSVPTDTPIFTPSTFVNIGANLRSGPSTNYDIVGRAGKGSPVEAVATSGDGRWLELVHGQWIYATLVDNIPAGLPVARNIPPTPTPTPMPTPTSTPTPTPMSTPTPPTPTPTLRPSAPTLIATSTPIRPTPQSANPVRHPTPDIDLTEYEHFMERGDELHQQERYAEAVEAYSNAVKANTGEGKLYWLRHARAYSARAIARFGQQCVYASILDFELALQTATYAGEPTTYNSIYASYSGTVDFYNQWGDGPCNRTSPLLLPTATPTPPATATPTPPVLNVRLPQAESLPPTPAPRVDPCADPYRADTVEKIRQHVRVSCEIEPDRFTIHNIPAFNCVEIGIKLEFHNHNSDINKWSIIHYGHSSLEPGNYWEMLNSPNGYWEYIGVDKDFDYFTDKYNTFSLWIDDVLHSTVICD